MTTKVICAIGSGSEIKKVAVQNSFPNAQVYCLNDFQSVVPPQPIGKEQTIEGAKGRADAALERYPNANFCFGIENGMYKDQGKWVDAACIYIIQNKGNSNVNRFVIWSDTIDIPDKFEKGPNGEWSILKDPHLVLTGGKRPRANFISDAINQWKLENNI